MSADMEIQEPASSLVPTPVLKQCGQRPESRCALKHFRFFMDEIEVREFEVAILRPLRDASGRQHADTSDDANREYKNSISLRIRQAHDESHQVNEARAQWRARRLIKKMKTDDESHLGFPREWLTHFREVIRRNSARAASTVPDESDDQGPLPGEGNQRPENEGPLPGEGNQRPENDEILSTDAVLGETLSSSADGSKQASTESAETGPTSGNAKKKTFGRTWNSLSNSVVRVAEVSNKRLSYARGKLWSRCVRSQNASHGTASHVSFFRWPRRNRSRVHSEFESVIPSHES
eukprot:TRINITY_DN13746_c0_g2_i1.p1 TRINITY_DN13746_c0_g2~~TRINITY_DN13746_c0_g2_i1.p1  ORF type:complete len:293 (-),score=19.89 TRINITY_DN13746_c0_g2_i1:27-905(-)